MQGLVDTCDLDEDQDLDGSTGACLLYKWLKVAADFGHDATEYVDASLWLLEDSADVNMVTGEAHFELAVGYLTGQHGLPVDLDRARRHLEPTAFWHFPKHVQDGADLVAEARQGMDTAARAVFDAALAAPEAAVGD